VQQADTGKYLNAYTPNVEDLLRDMSAIHPDRITTHLLHKPQLNLSALLGPATPDTANPIYFTGRRYAQILEALKPNYDYIIIDTPVAEFYHDMFREFALPMADFICVAVAPNITTLVNADMWLRQVTAPKNANGMGVPKENIGVVLNRAEEGIGCSEDEVRSNLAEWRYLGAIPETKEWKYCNNRGELVVTKNYHELNEAFSYVLAQATGEEMLMQGVSISATKKTGGLLSKFRKKKGE
jgi:septum formation inhibitor-activating ATPase MinD